MSPTPPPPPLYTPHAQAVLKDSCIQKPFRLRSDTVTLHPEQLMSTESRLQCWLTTGEARALQRTPGVAGGRRGRCTAVRTGRRRGISCPPSRPFSTFFLLLAEPVIAYRLFTQDGGATRRCTATVVLFLFLLAALYFVLFHPRTEPSLRSPSPLIAFFSVSSLRLCSLLTALHPPTSLSWLTGWMAARSEPQQKACAPLGAKVMLGGHIVLGEQEVCAERQYDPSLDSSNSRNNGSRTPRVNNPHFP